MRRGLDIILVGLALYGVLTIVNAVAFLSGVGPERTVHVERVRVDEMATTESGGMPVYYTVRVGEGSYVDDDGRRRSVELVGYAGRAGEDVRTRLPLLPTWLVIIAPHRTGQAVVVVFLGLLAILPAGLWLAFRDA